MEQIELNRYDRDIYDGDGGYENIEGFFMKGKIKVQFIWVILKRHIIVSDSDIHQYINILIYYS